MSGPVDPDDPQLRAQSRDGLHETAQQDLAALALGEPVDVPIDAHVRSCARCRHDVDALRHVAELARASQRSSDAPSGPPPQVWDRIADELGLAATPAADGPGTAVVPHAARAPRWRRALLAAAAIVALGATGVAGWAVGHGTSGSGTDRSSQALLAAQPGTPGAAHGEAVVHTSDHGYTLSVRAQGLPAPEGYYEVWLFNPSINQMVAVGTLGVGGRGSFTVPDGLDLRAYHVVDVSAQKYDGNNAHERSVLRGPLGP